MLGAVTFNCYLEVLLSLMEFLWLRLDLQTTSRATLIGQEHPGTSAPTNSLLGQDKGSSSHVLIAVWAFHGMADDVFDDGGITVCD